MALCKEPRKAGRVRLAQLDHDEKVGPMHGMYGTLDAELEVQRTIKRSELRPSCALERLSAPPCFTLTTSETPEGRSATLRVQGLVLFFDISCCTISCYVSIKKTFF